MLSKINFLWIYDFCSYIILLSVCSLGHGCTDDDDENELDELVTPSFTSVLGTTVNYGSNGPTSSVTSSSSTREKKSSSKKSIAAAAADSTTTDATTSGDAQSADKSAQQQVADLLNAASYKDIITGADQLVTTVVQAGDDAWMVQAKGEIAIEKEVERANTGL